MERYEISNGRYIERVIMMVFHLVQTNSQGFSAGRIACLTICLYIFMGLLFEHPIHLFRLVKLVGFFVRHGFVTSPFIQTKCLLCRYNKTDSSNTTVVRKKIRDE